jgi:hypothetical protein
MGSYPHRHPLSLAICEVLGLWSVGGDPLWILIVRDCMEASRP